MLASAITVPGMCAAVAPGPMPRPSTTTWTGQAGATQQAAQGGAADLDRLVLGQSSLTKLLVGEVTVADAAALLQVSQRQV
jgi:hypothetical protein